MIVTVIAFAVTSHLLLSCGISILLDVVVAILIYGLLGLVYGPSDVE